MNKQIFFILALLTLISCGGVIGNIEKYPFDNFSVSDLKAALNAVYLENPELKKTDTTMYGMNDGKNFYFMLDNGGERYVFVCNVVDYHDPKYGIDLSLTTATKWGDVMELAPRMSFFEKRNYRKLFEENILPKVKNGILNASQQKL